jgi:hypothetical protein
MRINRPKQVRVVERQIKYNDQCDHDDDYQLAHRNPPNRHRRICNFRTLRAAYRKPLKRVLLNFYAARPSALRRYCFTAPEVARCEDVQRTLEDRVTAKKAKSRKLIGKRK